MKKHYLLTYRDYILNEDFINPFDMNDETENKENKDKPSVVSSFKNGYEGGLLINPNDKLEDARLIFKNGHVKNVVAFKKGEIIEICPCRLLTSLDAIDELRDKLFELYDGVGVLCFGFGSLYEISEDNNLDYAYDEESNTMSFIANRDIRKGEILTINPDNVLDEDMYNNYAMDDQNYEVNTSPVRSISSAVYGSQS